MIRFIAAMMLIVSNEPWHFLVGLLLLLDL